MADHPIFDDITRGNLKAVKQRVLAEAAALEELGPYEMTPLMWAVCVHNVAMSSVVEDPLDLRECTMLHLQQQA